MSRPAGIAWLFQRRARRDRELDEEIRSHLRMAVEDRVARGETREEAERAVRREFGDPDRVKEITRTMWRVAWLDRLGQDLRFGVRSLRRDRAFAFAAVFVLTLGVGANAAVFMLANEVFFEHAPAISRPDELVGVRWIESAERGPSREDVWEYADYAYVRAAASVFDGVLAYMPEPVPVTVAEELGSRADASLVSDNYFAVLGAEMALGRGFLPEAGQTPGARPVVVVSHAFWQRRLGADPSVLQRTIALNGTPFTVVGVAARGFRGISPIESAPDLYVPLTMRGAVIPGSESWLERTEGVTSRWLRLVARLRDGTTVASARANLETVQAAWQDAFGAWWASVERPAFRMLVTPDYKLSLENAERLRRMLGLLAAIVGVILLIGIANVAILSMARRAAREGELAVRTALGAGRARLVAHLLVESSIVAVLGALGGVVLAQLAVATVVPLLPYPISWRIAPDLAVGVFIGAVMLVVTLLVGVVPSIRLWKAHPAFALRRTDRVTAGSGTRNVLVVVQMAGAMVLVAGAGLFVRSIVAAQSVDLGFEPDDRLVIRTDLTVRGYDDDRGLAFMNEALSRARALPGVEQATVVARVPFGGGRTTEGVRLPGASSAESRTVLDFNWIGPGYFETMGIPIVTGRAIEARDEGGSSRSLVVNETAAARLWPGESAVGRTMIWQGEAWTVVGVAADASYYTLGEAQATQVYVPIAQDFVPYLTFVLETAVPPETLARNMESVVRGLDPKLRVSGARTLRDLVDRQSASYRLLAVVGSAFGLVALVLAVAGLYAVQSYTVGQRFKEIGIRIAMGAQSWQVSADILRHGAVLAGIGVGLGLLAAFALGRTIEGMLFDVEARDAATLSAVAAVLVIASMAASGVSARRAGRVQPVTVLKEH